ncbi:STAS domain-containing protein [Streptomyces sp. A1136]|uniref:STAS domain-containing protein n=1 Tax=Streptomyces sp. A1136 TaxID=2563102 RepID=UPI0023F2FF1D|nr:STAS domain-containing protein [Streptomyces sp. A1136]
MISSSAGAADVRQLVVESLKGRSDDIADRWVLLQMERAPMEPANSERELRYEADTLSSALLTGLDTTLPFGHLVHQHRELREAVRELSMRRARAGATPTATAMSVLALKDVLLELLRETVEDTDRLFAAAVLIDRLLDAAGALSFATYVEGREDIIRRQSRQLLEVSTPVVRLWRQVVAVPLIGTLDTARTQVVMENLLQAIQDEDAQVAIIDITGVPTVDTAVAQHLMQTVRAVRLMGADCVISGIRPTIAQTIAQLGIDLSDILTRATLAEALSEAMKITGGSAPAPRAPVAR